MGKITIDERLLRNHGFIKEGKMSKNYVIYLDVNVKYDKDTGTLEIRDQNGKQLDLLYVVEED